MRLVIDIPDYDYRQIKEYYEKNDTVEATYSYIYHGTPLPKGHGDIVDIETLIDMFWDGNSMEITKYDLSVIDPIIEADKEQEE